MVYFVNWVKNQNLNVQFQVSLLLINSTWNLVNLRHLCLQHPLICSEKCVLLVQYVHSMINGVT